MRLVIIAQHGRDPQCWSLRYTHLDEVYPIPLLSSTSNCVGQIPCIQRMHLSIREMVRATLIRNESAAMKPVIAPLRRTLSSPLFNHCRPGCTFCP